jgi:hypothetical protein
VLRKLFSILLLALFGLPLASPLFALGNDAEMRVPACCRRAGAHHCTGMAERGAMQEDKAHFKAPAERCPYSPGTVAAGHLDLLGLTTSATLASALQVHPSGVIQTESKWRLSRSRSRQKRGPPALFSL